MSFLPAKRELSTMRWLRELIKRELYRRNIVLSRPPGQFHVGHHKLRALKQRGFAVRCAIDGGAATGNWALELRQVYPDAAVLCVEPRADAQAALRELAQSNPGIHIANVLLGPREDQVSFNESSVRSSVLNDADGRSYGRTTTATMTTLDRLVEQQKLPSPDLIKLDLQGYELEALRGATRCLEHAQAVLLEVSFIPIQARSPIAHEVIAFMHERGFVVYDVFGLWHRPLDGALAQGDILFVRQSSSLLRDTRWAAGDVTHQDGGPQA
jgi:FkbM family methyltransferase